MVLDAMMTAKQLELFAAHDSQEVHSLGLLGWRDPLWTTKFEIRLLDGTQLPMTLVGDPACPSADTPSVSDLPAAINRAPCGTRVRFCTWCKQIDIRGARRENDVILLYIHGNEQRAFWNGRAAIIQDGICEACAVELRATGRVSKKGAKTL
jgi:hypothetical protein